MARISKPTSRIRSPFFFIFLWILIAGTHQAKSDGSTNYLYNVLPFDESDPVIEFEPPAANQFFNSKGEDLALKPDFLYSTSEKNHRVVLFYLPYCPHCQALVPVYVSLARRVQDMIQSQNIANVDFYAVSCLPNKLLCRDQHVGGIPAIKIFRAGSTEGVPEDPTKLHPFEILRILGVPWGASDDWNAIQSRRDKGGSLKGGGNSRVGEAKYNSNNNKQKIYQDCYKSFHYALENEIYTEKGPLSEKSRKALSDWLHLLQNVLPSTWEAMHKLLEELITNFDDIVKEESRLQAILEKHPPKSDEWTHACSHGISGHGYTCGLWNLMTITTLGVVLYNENAAGSIDHALYHSATVARTIRDYVEHFFACDVCRREFLQSFDSCAHDRCHRLVNAPGKKRSWIELPLWLWQEHNAVSVRLLKEHTGVELEKQELEAAKWPPYSLCPNCWISDDSSFNSEVTYEFLLETHWPGVSRTKEQRMLLYGSDVDLLQSTDDPILAIPYSLLLIPLIGPTCLLVMCCRQRYAKHQSGRRKKLDL